MEGYGATRKTEKEGLGGNCAEKGGAQFRIEGIKYFSQARFENVSTSGTLQLRLFLRISLLEISNGRLFYRVHN